jgi:hypothetical protein
MREAIGVSHTIVVIHRDDVSRRSDRREGCRTIAGLPVAAGPSAATLVKQAYAPALRH